MERLDYDIVILFDIVFDLAAPSTNKLLMGHGV